MPGCGGNDDSLVMLGNDFHSVMVGQYGDVGVLLHSFNEAGLYLCTRIVPWWRMRNSGGRLLCAGQTLRPPFCRSSLPFDKLLDLFGALRTTFSTASRSLIQSPAIMVSSICFSKLSTARLVTEAIPPCAKNKCLPLPNLPLQMRATVPFMRYFQRKTHTGKSGADNEKIELSLP